MMVEDAQKNDLVRLDESRREVQWPPASTIRRLCRSFEVKAAEALRFRPRQTATLPFDAQQQQQRRNRRSVGYSETVRHSQLVFELSRQVQSQVELLEDMLATRDEEIHRLKQRLAHDEHGLLGQPHANEQTPATMADTELLFKQRLARIEQATVDFQRSLQKQSRAERTRLLTECQAKVRKVEQEAEDRIERLEGQLADMKRSIQRAMPRSAASEELHREETQDMLEQEDPSHEEQPQPHAAHQEQRHQAGEIQPRGVTLSEVAQAGNSAENREASEGNVGPPTTAGAANAKATATTTTTTTTTERHPTTQTAVSTTPRTAPRLPSPVGAELHIHTLEGEKRSMEAAWLNEKSRGAELHMENTYLRSRVKELNRMVRMLQDAIP